MKGWGIVLCPFTLARRQGKMNTAESQLMCDRFHRDPCRVRRVELVHQPPGGEYERVTVEYVNGEVRVHVVHKSLLADLLEEINPVDSQAWPRPYSPECAEGPFRELRAERVLGNSQRPSNA